MVETAAVERRDECAARESTATNRGLGEGHSLLSFALTSSRSQANEGHLRGRCSESHSAHRAPSCVRLSCALPTSGSRNRRRVLSGNGTEPRK